MRSMLVAIGVALAFGSTAHASLELKPCDLETPEMPRVHAECGEVVVDDGVHVGFAVLHATDAKKKRADPLVLLPGGPGQSSTELAGLATIMFAPFRKHRDVILFDPRGTGRSHKLSCPERSLEQKLKNDSAADDTWLASCAAKLDLDPKSITTARIAKDLEAVRGALGVDVWNVAGISYGTRLALEYDRLYRGKARVLVLDGPVPFSMIIGAQSDDDADAALADVDRRFLEAAPNAPHENAPSAVAARLKRALDEKPRDVTLSDPRSGKQRTLHIDGEALVAAIRGALYAEETAALLPQVLVEAEHDNFTPLAAQIVLANQLEESIAQPMQLSVICAEDVPFLPSTKHDAKTPAGFFAGSFDDLVRACKTWPHADVAPAFHDDAPTSTTPALILSGTADPVTPVHAANDVKKTLPNAFVVEAKGFGHNIVFRECIPKLVGEFLDEPAALKQTDVAACVAKLHAFPVFVDASGPQP